MDIFIRFEDIFNVFFNRYPNIKEFLTLLATLSVFLFFIIQHILEKRKQKYLDTREIYIKLLVDPNLTESNIFFDRAFALIEETYKQAKENLNESVETTQLIRRREIINNLTNFFQQEIKNFKYFNTTIQKVLCEKLQLFNNDYSIWVGSTNLTENDFNSKLNKLSSIKADIILHIEKDLKLLIFKHKHSYITTLLSTSKCNYIASLLSTNKQLEKFKIGLKIGKSIILCLLLIYTFNKFILNEDEITKNRIEHILNKSISHTNTKMISIELIEKYNINTSNVFSKKRTSEIQSNLSKLLIDNKIDSTSHSSINKFIRLESHVNDNKLEQRLYKIIVINHQGEIDYIFKLVTIANNKNIVSINSL